MSDKKEAAEHATIVDLIRNDLLTSSLIKYVFYNWLINNILYLS